MYLILPDFFLLKKDFHFVSEKNICLLRMIINILNTLKKSMMYKWHLFLLQLKLLDIWWVLLLRLQREWGASGHMQDKQWYSDPFSGYAYYETIFL